MTAPPTIELAIFHLQDVCVHVQKGMRSRLRTAGLEKAPQIDATFRWLRKRNIRICLLSDYDKEGTAILLDRLNWKEGDDGLVQYVLHRGDFGDNPVQSAMEYANLSDPAKTIVVVDTPELLNSAAGANVGYNLGVTSGRCSYQALANSSCQALLDHTLQLVNYLVGQSPALGQYHGAPRVLSPKG